MTTTTAATGTLYALNDPRNGVTRYIGQTTKPLTIRLAGHIASPATKVAPWIEELKNAGLKPVIVALRQQLPVDGLLDAEREEITRRLIAGEPLLNEAATAKARKVIRQQNADARTERLRAAWEEAACRTRAALGGPPPPGDIPSVPFPESVWEHMPGLWQARDALGDLEQVDGGAFNADRWAVQRKVADAAERLSSQLWNGVRAGWGLMRGRDDKVDKKLEETVRGTIEIQCASMEDATRLATLAPWCIIAVTPWAALASRAGLSLDFDDFTSWVTEQPEVEDALRFVGRYRPRMLYSLAEMETHNDPLRASAHLVAVAAAHAPFDAPSEIAQDLTRVLRHVARDQMLTAGMADLLAHLDPLALDDVFGRDLAKSADSSLNLPAGTAASVLAYILDNSHANYGVLSRVLARAAGKLPCRTYPSYSTWNGPGICINQAIVETLYATGLVTGPGEPTAAEAKANALALWASDLERIRGERD